MGDINCNCFSWSVLLLLIQNCARFKIPLFGFLMSPLSPPQFPKQFWTSIPSRAGKPRATGRDGATFLKHFCLKQSRQTQGLQRRSQLEHDRCVLQTLKWWQTIQSAWPIGRRRSTGNGSSKITSEIFRFRILYGSSAEICVDRDAAYVRGSWNA